MSRGASDMCPFMMGFERLVDPQDDAALWQVQSHKVNISTHALHYQRSLCLSLPVVGARDEEHNDAVMAQAKTLVLWWLGEIQAHRVQLDRNVIFA
ncbi:hypothetical protein N7449_006522 [Penicillium cf. viridicatum]|uniref:Uncharacterized protein n=1 Tax=Penicillium cf. viridicatum TaxID=2972119 RepID=A0A9W9MBP6_9EURO|nr:hypothetical protein N7449_006522 [Penicillium cf. viridicatum]